MMRYKAMAAQDHKEEYGTAIDGCGNTSTASRTATWIHDVTPPSILTGGNTLEPGMQS